MNFKKFPWIIAAVVIIGGYSYVKGINNAVGYEQGINEAWGNVQTSYQRNDLIGNLVNTVKGC
jgi:LemA protein